MKEIFTDLYKKLAGFFRSEEKEEASKDVACNRLKLVLMQDRTNLTPQLLERMRGELIDLLSKYVEMDKDALELNFEHEGEQMALMLSIPVLRAKDEEEIQAIIDKEDQAKKEQEEQTQTEEAIVETLEEAETEIEEEETDESSEEESEESFEDSFEKNTEEIETQDKESDKESSENQSKKK